MEARFGKFLCYHDDCVCNFENAFASLMITYKDNDYRLEVSVDYHIDIKLSELLNLQLKNQIISKEKADEIISILKQMSIDITDDVKKLFTIGDGPYLTLKQQYQYYHYFILTRPEKILIKFKQHLQQLKPRYRFWHRWLGLNYIEKLLDEVDDRIALLAHTETIRHYYTRAERRMYSWI